MLPASIANVCPWVPPERSAVTQYVLEAARTLSESARVDVVWVGEGQEAAGARRTVSVPEAGVFTVRGLLRVLGEIRPERVVVQYSPYLWTRSGFDLTAAALALALRWRGAPPDVVFHELWVPAMPRPVGLLRGLFQRAAAGVLARGARRVVVTSRERLLELERVGAAAEALVLVPMTSLVSVVPLEPGERERLRAELGLADGELALVLFGFDHDSRPTAGLWRVRQALADAGLPSRLLVIGTARVPGDAAMRAWIRELGYCSAGQVSRWFAASDLFVARFVDGVSTRRTSVAAALAHGLPVVTTAGPHTDAGVFTDGVVALAPVDDVAAFASRVVELARSHARRAELGQAGRALFERALSWPRHAAALLEVDAT